ncbi:MAG: DNA methyltransferase, partial [Mariniphaga sp.]
NGKYQKKCRENGIKRHPARFPVGFSDFFIKFLTDKNDLVLDPFAGSNTTGYSAEKLGRRWISLELNENYLEGSIFRFFDENSLFTNNLVVSEPLEKHIALAHEKE